MSTRRRPGRLEDAFFLSVSGLALAAAVGAVLVGSHWPSGNPRVRYGMEHLPWALAGIAGFAALVGVARRRVWGLRGVEDAAAARWVWSGAGVAAVFAACWLPVWLAGGLVQDDWMLLAAATVRKIVFLHPWYSWRALDSVDGNFRPLGTVLYFAGVLRGFGMAARAYTLGPLAMTLLAGLVGFRVVRAMGYTRAAAGAAAMLFWSRGMIYTVAAWASALGDGIAIVFCGLCALLVLRANRRIGAAALGWHAAAWACFAVATLGKQSAFVMPLIVALLLLLRPGEDRLGPPRGRIASAALGIGIYGATAALVFHHAKTLLRAPSPYPIGITAQSLGNLFSYATWYLAVMQFPDRMRALNLLPPVLGMGIVAGMVWAARRVPGLLGTRPRDAAFACAAAAASVSLFALLETRSAAYYGSMAAFWLSVALGIALTRFGWTSAGGTAGRVCGFVFCALLVTGFAEIRLEQSGLFPSGGYIWGTYGMDTDRRTQVEMRAVLTGAEQAAVVLEGCPYVTPDMLLAMTDASAVQRVLVYKTGTDAYLANDRRGLRPDDGLAALTDTGAYNWRTPMDAAAAQRISAEGPVIRLVCRDGHVEPGGREASVSFARR